MNKQEAINKLKKHRVGFGEAASVRFDRAVSVIGQIHEPQKVVVPKFVAEWIESEKSRKRRLSQALSSVFGELELNLYIKQQLGDYTEIIARAWLDGYEIEQEKLYAVNSCCQTSRGRRMIPKIETCEECGWKYKEGASDYDSIFQTGYCGDCLVERVERGEEW